MIPQKTIKNEFSRMINLKDVVLETRIEISADENELKNLAKRFEVLTIKSVYAEYTISNKADIPGAFLLSVSLNSSVVKFIIEGKEENLEINEAFDVVLIDEENAKANEELLKDYDIEIIDDNCEIDIGEIAAQYLSLCIFM